MQSVLSFWSWPSYCLSPQTQQLADILRWLNQEGAGEGASWLSAASLIFKIMFHPVSNTFFFTFCLMISVG